MWGRKRVIIYPWDQIAACKALLDAA